MQLAVIFNVLILVLSVIGIGWNWLENGLEMFQYYTVDSNLLNILAVLCITIAEIRSVHKDEFLIPTSIKTFKYVATVCVALTFTIVLFVLGPQTGSLSGFIGIFTVRSNLFLHLLCPLLSFLTLCLFEYDPPQKKTAILKALCPTILYAIITIILNALNLLDGPYFFLKVNEQPLQISILWTCIVLGIDLILAIIFYLGSKRNQRI